MMRFKLPTKIKQFHSCWCWPIRYTCFKLGQYKLQKMPETCINQRHPNKPANDIFLLKNKNMQFSQQEGKTARNSKNSTDLYQDKHLSSSVKDV